MTQEQMSKKRVPQKVMVTGGGGFLGKAIVKLLVERGDDVVSFSRNHYTDLAAMGVQQILGDISDKVAVENACKDLDLLFHVAAKPGIWGDYTDYYKTNVLGTQNVISACQKHHVSRLVYTSSPSVIFGGTSMEGVDESVPYPDNYSAHYPRTKAIAEQQVVRSTSESLKTIILRPHLIWGPGDNHLVPRIIERANRLIRVGSGQNLVDTIYIDNAAEGHILAANRLEENHNLSGKIYFISQGDPLPLWEMVDNILMAAGLAPVQRSMPYSIAWLAGAFLELVYKTFNIRGEPQMTRFLAKELATAHWFNINAARNDLGYRPRVSTKKGLVRLENWLKNR